MSVAKLRKRFFKKSPTSVGMISLPLLLQADPQDAPAKKKIVVVGGHPNDPECGAGGTVPLLVKAGARSNTASAYSLPKRLLE